MIFWLLLSKSIKISLPLFKIPIAAFSFFNDNTLEIYYK